MKTMFPMTRLVTIRIFLCWSSAEVSDTVLSPVVPDVSWRTVRRSSSIDITGQGRLRMSISRLISRPGPGLHQGEGEGEEGEEEDQEDGEA